MFFGWYRFCCGQAQPVSLEVGASNLRTAASFSAEAKPRTTEQPPRAVARAAAKPSTAQQQVPQVGLLPGVTKQVMLSTPHYLTAAEWEFFCNPHKSDQAKAMVGVKLVVRLGLWKVPEGFYGSFAGLILACTGRDNSDPGMLLMRNWLKYFASQAKPTGIDFSNLVYHFPENPMTLPEPWRSRSQSDGATVASRLSPSSWQAIINMSPSRITHKAIKDQCKGLVVL